MARADRSVAGSFGQGNIGNSQKIMCAGLGGAGL